MNTLAAIVLTMVMSAPTATLKWDAHPDPNVNFILYRS